jgi:hypothetical protein
LKVGDPTLTGPVTVTPDKACAVLVDVELPVDGDDAELGDPPYAKRTMLRLRSAATPPCDVPMAVPPTGISADDHV